MRPCTNADLIQTHSFETTENQTAQIMRPPLKLANKIYIKNKTGVQRITKSKKKEKGLLLNK
jgi:hypothetical protein